jgi:two-component system CheB/CheR fusion protein
VFPIIGLGASAGGLQALHQFFDAMPPDSGMAFVVILHLSPDHESHAAHILQQSTAMPVQQVTALESASHYPKVNPHNKQYMFPYPASARLPDT